MISQTSALRSPIALHFVFAEELFKSSHSGVSTPRRSQGQPGDKDQDPARLPCRYLRQVRDHEASIETDVRREWDYVTHSTERLPESGKHREIGVERDVLQAAHAERRESVVVLQAAKLALDCGAASVEVAEPLRVTGDAWEQWSAQRYGHDCLPALCAAEGDHRFASSFLAFGVDASIVIALVSRHRLRPEAASVEGVQERGNIQRFLPPNPPRGLMRNPRALGIPCGHHGRQAPRCARSLPHQPSSARA